MAGRPVGRRGSSVSSGPISSRVTPVERTSAVIDRTRETGRLFPRSDLLREISRKFQVNRVEGAEWAIERSGVLRLRDQDRAVWISTALTAAPISATFGSRTTKIGICSTSVRIEPLSDKASRKQADRRTGTIWDPIPPPM